MLARILDRLFLVAGVLAGVFLVAIAVLVLGQIGTRLVGKVIPSADEFAGFCLAATSFLGLAHAYRKGAHIRVTLFLDRAPPGLRRILEVVALSTATLVVGMFAWHTVSMWWLSIVRGEVTSGLVPLPMWLPQAGMALGVLLFAVALAEDLVRAIRGRPLSFSDKIPNE